MNLNELQARFEQLRGEPINIVDIAMKYGGPNYKVPDQIGSEWGAFLEWYIHLKPKTVLEIGTYQGGSLWYLVKYAAPGATVVSVDVDHSQCTYWGELQELRPDVKLVKISGRSEEASTIEQVFQITDRYDFTFIDGWHLLPIVELDWTNYGKRSRTCAFHDIGWGVDPSTPQDVRLVWNKVVAEYPGSTAQLIHKEGTHATYGIGVVQL